MAAECLVAQGGRLMAAYRCPGCGYVYDEANGAAREGFPAGTPWDKILDDWCCPDCAVREALGWPEDGIAPGTRWDDIPNDWSCPDCGAAKSDFHPPRPYRQPFTVRVGRVMPYAISSSHDQSAPVRNSSNRRTWGRPQRSPTASGTGMRAGDLLDRHQRAGAKFPAGKAAA